MRGVVKTLRGTAWRPPPPHTPVLGCQAEGLAHMGSRTETEAQGTRSGVTPPQFRGGRCRDAGAGAGSGGGSDSPAPGRRGPRRLGRPGPEAAVPAGARTQGSPGGRRLRPVGGSGDPRGFPTVAGPDAGSRLQAPRSPRADPDPQVCREAGAAGRSPRPPRGPRSARRRPASARTCRGPGGRPGSALRAASSPPLLNGAEAALRPAQTRPIERPTRRRLGSRAPSHRGGAPWRERPLLQRSAGHQ